VSDHSSASPIGSVARAIRACGERLIDSCPPATTTSGVALAIDCAPSIDAYEAEPQTLLMVIEGIMCGSPALIAAWRAGFLPDAGRQDLPP